MSAKKEIKHLLKNKGLFPPRRKMRQDLKRIVRECNNGDK